MKILSLCCCRRIKPAAVLTIWLLLVALVVVVPFPVSIKWGSAAVFTLAYGWFLFWSSANIRSGVYVATVNCNRAKTNQVALTFDDGPDNATPEILDLLARYNAKATFFVIGSKIEGREDVLRRMVAEGHLTGNHSWFHTPFFAVQAHEKIRAEIEQARQTLERVTGLSNVYFRPPYGVTNPLVAKALNGLGMQVVGWTVRSLDTKNEPVEVVFKRVTKAIKGGDIVLLHDTSKNIMPLLSQLLAWLKTQNIEAVTVHELLKD